MKRMAVLLVGLTLNAVAQAASIADIPLENCTPGNVLMTMNQAARDRYLSGLKTNTERWHQLSAMADKHPGQGKKPMGELLTKSELTDFNRISDQIAVSNFYLLAESRLERDTSVMMDMLSANEAIRDGKPLPDAKSPDIKPYIYLYRLHEALKSIDHPAVKNTAECSLNLALQLESDRATAEISNKLANSAEFREVMGIRAKYGMPDGASFDTVKLSRADSERLKIIAPKVSSLVINYRDYIVSLYNMMYFSDVTILEYEGQKADILQQGSASANDLSGYEKLQKARYQSLSPAMQRVVDLWFFIDSDTPSDQYKNSLAIKATEEQESVKR